MLNIKSIALAIALVIVAYTAQAESASGNNGHKAAETGEHQYTFAWNFTDSADLKPRGGTSKGVPVTLDTQPSSAWLRLQEKGISDLERDRRAILAMVGDYKVSFDFIEVAGFTENYQPKAPYQSWATERVYVLEDKGEFISLQHILVMQTVEADGKVNPPIVTKHWRQDWQYQPKQVLVFKGNSTWQAEEVALAEQKKGWSQTVYQVDDSPRYGGVARWQHFGNFSSWNNQEAWRPLPRREYTVRNDYQVLLGNNRHIILPTGWVHEQQNNKVMLDKEAKPNVSNPVIAREMGFNRYERIKGYDFALGDTYLKNTEPFWREIRNQWTVLSQQKAPIHLRALADKDGLYVVPFGYALALNNGKQQTPAEMASFAKKTVADYLAKEASTANSQY
jgi:hypothetical protein